MNKAEHDFENCDREEIGLRLLDFTRLWAHWLYGWNPGQLLPQGHSDEDIVSEVFVAYDTQKRHFNDRQPMMNQLKGAVRSTLWNLYQRKETKLSMRTEVETLQHIGDPAETPDATLLRKDLMDQLFSELLKDPKIKKKAELQALVIALRDGVMELSDLITNAGTRYEHNRHLVKLFKEIAQRILKRL